MGMPSIQSGNLPNAGLPQGGLTPESLSSVPTESLQSMIGDTSLSTQDRQAVLAELARRKQAESPSEESGGGGEEDSIGDLLNKLTSGEPLTDEEMQKLAKALGVNPSDLKGLAGQGATSQGGGDIQ